MRKLLFLALLCPCFSLCQPLIITGTVLNEEKTSVAGATVLLKKAGLATATNVQGEFRLLVQQSGDTLLVTAVGYIPTNKIISSDIEEKITITLRRQTGVLEGVYVSTGYQQLPKERSTGSFERINTTVLNRVISQDWLSRLEGVSSLYFDKRQSASTPLTIRGRSTIFANASPLIVLDNFPFEGDIDHINPNDIESITILKDAAAASIWGTRAANGVVVITTKKGKYNRAPALQVSINTTVGEKLDIFYTPAISSSDFIDTEIFLFQKGFYNGVLNNRTTRPVISPVVEILAQRKAGLISSTDSATAIDGYRLKDVRNDFEKYLLRQSVATQYAFSLHGGSENMTYYLSTGYDRTKANLVANENDRLTVSGRLSVQPIKPLEISFNTAYIAANTTANNPYYTISVGGGKSVFPYAQLVDSDGTASVWPKDYRLSYVDTAGGGKLLDWKYRLLDEMKYADNKSKETEWRMDVRTSLALSEHISTELLYQYQQQNWDRVNRYDQASYFTRNLINRFYDPSVGMSAVPMGDIVDRTSSPQISHSGRAQLNYGAQWNGHSEINALAGAEIRQVSSSFTSERIYGYDSETLTTVNVNFADKLPVYGKLAGAQQIPNQSSLRGTELRTLSWYANASYTLNGRYTVSASARRDASNLFGVATNQKWVPLWSAGAAWTLSKESFFKIDGLRLLRLRATYGYNGNVDNTLSAYTTIRYFSNAMFTGGPYARIMTPPNPELRWEKTAVLNLGMDFETSSLIGGGVEFFRKKGNDIIGESPLDPTTGVYNNQLNFSFKGNVASLISDGIEMSLHGDFAAGPIKLSSEFQFSYVNSRVSDYLKATVATGSFLTNGLMPNPIAGRPLFTIYSYRWAGLDPSNGDPLGIIDGIPSKDYNKLINVNPDELVYHGSAVPTIFGSFRNALSWNNFSVSANIIYKLNYWFRRLGMDYTSLYNNWEGSSDFMLRWQKPGDEMRTNVPSMPYPLSNNRERFYSASEVLVDRGDHIRLHDIAFSYKALVNKFSFKSLVVYGYIANVGILWKKNAAGLDPDYTTTSRTPLPRTYSIGIKADF